ncbi:hypothetical protein KUCAC02_008219 [Chaenocephalus aceratus]|uniref:Uncharacterized protein n=1 Tax=Chaenocephalus aceratus TaxID=36190 RepID=A0ACB9X9W4_CHAAC|nr:hypothetical protein KUCAC02_008219 [Chaenocephalus aceratus]
MTSSTLVYDPRNGRLFGNQTVSEPTAAVSHDWAEKEEEEEEEDVAQEEVRSPPPWSEERCEELWDRVEGVRHKLTRILHPAKLTPYLRQCKVIDEQDEDEVLNSTQYPLRISKAGRLLDILRGQGPRGLQAFMESLEFYHPDQFTQLTGQQPTQRCSLILDEEGPEGLTQFLLLEVRKLREQLRNSRLCERRLSQRCRMAEDERSRAERKAQELRQHRLQLERLRQDWESACRELGKLKDRHLEQAVKYSRALEEQGKASSRERELLGQVEELKSRLTEAENQTTDPPGNNTLSKINSFNGLNGSPPALPEKPLHRIEVQKSENKETRMRGSVPATGVRALMDILQQDRREAVEQRQELCDVISRLRGELQGTEEDWDKLVSQCEHLKLKERTLQLDWETEQKRSLSYFNQIMELEKERDQALRSRDSLQLEFTDCLLDKNRLRKRIAELPTSPSAARTTATAPAAPSASTSDPRPTAAACARRPQVAKPMKTQRVPVSTRRRISFHRPKTKKEINRLSTFPFPPCMNSINRRCNIEFDLESWGSDENDNITGEPSEPSLWDSWNSLHSHLFPPDLVNLPAVSPHQHNLSVPRKRKASLADDITIVGGNQTGIFISHVRAGSPAELCGLKEGSELLEVWSGSCLRGGSVSLGQCTAEVAHFSLQWWADPSSLKHRINTEGYSELRSQLSSPSFKGVDSFYVRVNLNMEPHGDPPSLAVSCDDIVHVRDTRHNEKAQQLLLVRLRKMALEQKDFKRKFLRKAPGRVRLVKAVDPGGRGNGSTKQLLYTLRKRHEEHLIPYSLVQPVQVQTKRPVIFSPSLLSRGLIERLLQPAESGLKFNTCPPEPIQASEKRDKKVFLLDSSIPEQALGIRLQSIQEVISQDKHCLLELGLHSVEGLLRQGIYPIVIHVRPKNKKHKTLRKLFPRCGEDSVMEEVCQAEELQLETLPLLYFSLEASAWKLHGRAAGRHLQHHPQPQRAVAWIELDRLQ